MNNLKNIFAITLLLIVAFSCKKEVDNLNYLDNVQAPANLVVKFDVTQDNTGLVTIMPTAEGATKYLVKFGDVADETPVEYGLNESITHTYEEGVFTVEVTAKGITGLTTKAQEELNVTFKAPENLVVNITQDEVNPRIVRVSATADFATVMEIYFGDVADEEPVTALPGEEVEHTYADPGDYDIKVVAKSGGAATIEYTETITISAASDPVTLPIDFESFTVNYAFTDFGNAVSSVIDNPDATGINTSARVAQMVKTDGAETWAGAFLTLETPIDFTVNKIFKVKTWSPKAGATVKFKVENLDNGDINMEVDGVTTVSNEWEELSFDFSAINMDNSYQKVVIFFDFGNPGDASTYYYDDIKQTSSSPAGGITGTWKVAAEAGAIGVGPEQGDISWWSIDEAGVTDRACYFDDKYVFAADGSFSNVQDGETWVEEWQSGVPDGCGTPVAPHDGSNAATFTYDEGAGTVTLNGTGAYLGLAKAYNGGELTDPADAPESITYIVEFSENNTVMTVDINVGSGWWRYKLVKEGGQASPFEGTWQMAPEAGSLGVGPEQGDISWWSIDEAGVTDRACYFDDKYVFAADGSFSNVLDGETWVEEWQSGVPDGCGTPVAPHDGSNAATFSYDEGAGTLTLNGTGAYLGLPKAYNGGELTDPADAPESITYIIEFSENNTVLTVDINVGSGWWRYKLVKN